MKLRLSPVFGACAFGLLLSQLPLSAQSLKVMQWNIHGTLGNISSNNTAGAQALARIVNYNQPDILLFNELQDNGVAADTAALIDWVTNNVPYLGAIPGSTFWVAVSSIGDGFERNGAISRYPISNETTYDDGLRGLHAFQVQLTATNLQVFHAHLKCCSTGTSCSEKQTEAQFDADTIASWANANTIPYIFGGDWNEDEENPECTLSSTYHPITTIREGAGMSEFKPTTLSGQYRTWSTAATTPSIRFDYLLPASNRLSAVSGYVFSSMDWASHGLYTDVSSQNLSGDSQAASDHYCVFATYSFPTPATGLAVSPAGGLDSAGSQGGPFTPTAQIYTLTNLGLTTFGWAASNTAAWLTVSPAGGTLPSGATTNVTVSINTNANNLAVGLYSDTVQFTNTTDGTGATNRAVTLNIGSGQPPQFAVSPSSGFSASGPSNGPFTPPSQSYTLTNPGVSTISWTATNAASWLTLSATNGVLAPGSATTVTVSLNGNANSLAPGGYSDSVSFANTTSGDGGTTRAVSLTVSSFGFVDDFSTFTSGNLVGQSNWTQLSTISALPLQVSGGQVLIPSGQTVDNQDAYKNLTQTSSTVFYGLTLIVNSPVTNASPSYFTALYTSINAGGFANYRLTAKAGDSSKTNFVLGVRVTGQSGDPYTFGSVLLSTGVHYRVIVQAPAGGASVSVYVNPTSSDLASQTAYAVNPIGSGTAPTSVGSS
jgi:hypothetical protein